MAGQLELFPEWEQLRKNRTLAWHDGDIQRWRSEAVHGQPDRDELPMTEQDYARWVNIPFMEWGVLHVRD